MSRFMERQLRSAESKQLGKTKNRYSYNEETGVGRMTQYREDASKAPPNTIQMQTPVGRTNAVCKPGSEREGERSEASGVPLGVPKPGKRNRTP